MSLVPDQLHLKSADETQTIDIFISGGGVQKIETTNSLQVKCNNSLTLQAYDAKLQLGGNISFANADSSQQYFLPNPNTNFPNLNDTILFNFDGTARFGSAGGGNFSTPSSVALDMNTHAINNITDLNLVSPTDAGSIASLNVRDNATTLSTNKPLSISCAGQDMELVGNNIRCRIGDGIFAVFNNSPLGYYVFPSQASPSVDNSYIKFGANGFSTFEPFPTIPSPPSGSAFMYNPANADLNMANYSISDATDVSTLNYSLETVGSDVDTLKSQVASLITIINNLTGIQV
jgi:hypothetical protein